MASSTTTTQSRPRSAVCRWSHWTFILFSSHFTFCVASEIAPISSTSLKTAGTISTNHTILIALSISAMVLSWVALMAYFKFLKLKIQRKTKKERDPERGSSKSRVSDGLNLDPQSENSVRRFNWDEIEKLTKNFSYVVGEGGFSLVYLADFSNSTLGAVKIHRNSERLNRVFKQELEVLLSIRHENIVKLLGYCDEREEGALVFEFVPNGSLQDKLHDKGSKDLLPWNRRMSIAFQLARAIEYLHENCSLQIVHSDIKASNILLDEQLNCKLCDFGSAKMGFSSMVRPSPTNMVMGSPGYVDPHYLRTGIISKKNDIYSFGVLVLELITGIEAFCSEKEQLLTSLASQVLRDPTKVAEMVDSRLQGTYDREEALVMASISALCLHEQPSLRPSTADILRTLKEKVSSVSFVAEKFKEIV